MVDASASEKGRSPAEDLQSLVQELGLYDEALLDKPALVFANKYDLEGELSPSLAFAVGRSFLMYLCCCCFYSECQAPEKSGQNCCSAGAGSAPGQVSNCLAAILQIVKYLYTLCVPAVCQCAGGQGHSSAGAAAEGEAAQHHQCECAPRSE